MNKERNKKYYHATSIKNFEPIIENGIKCGCDGLVYLTESEVDALKFISIRCDDDIVIFEVNLPKDEVIETFDHSYVFFKCKAFGYPHDIPSSNITDEILYMNKKNRKEN